jgi:enoyl-CoA hydratase
MDYKHVILEKQDRVARIILNRPDYRNAQSTALLKELDRAFEEAAADDDVRVIILAGAGDHFSSGHDLGTPDERADAGSYLNTKGLTHRHRRSWELFLDNTLRWRDLPKPTIAQVQGYCIFGGYMFASAMDLIVAADDAMFLPSLTQYFSAPWDVGVRKSKEILFQSRFIDAQEALRIGLVNLVVPRADLEKATLALAFACQSATRIRIISSPAFRPMRTPIRAMPLLSVGFRGWIRHSSEPAPAAIPQNNPPRFATRADSARTGG